MEVELNNFRKSNKYCDVKIIIGDATFEAHKVVLAAASDFFAEHLMSDTEKLTVDCVSSNIFESILDFIYTGKIAINSDNVTVLKEAAETLGIQKLTEFCQNNEVSSDEAADDAIESSFNSNITNAIRRTEPVPIFPKSKRSDRKAKQDAYVTMNRAFAILNSAEDEMEVDYVRNYSDEDIGIEWNPENKYSVKADCSNSSLVCQICTATFVHVFYYQLHILCHDELPSQDCGICGKPQQYAIDGIENDLEIDTTLNSIETVKDRAWTCDICYRTFTTAHNLSVHLKTHNKPVTVSAKKESGVKKNHDCNVCGKSFRSTSHLKRHMITHTGERKHCCTTCGKLFLKGDHLKRHERIHTSERPFTCEKCGKNFRDKDHLKRHSLSHTDIRPYFCEICGKQFKDKSTLISHQKGHSATASACKQCGKIFKTAERLEAHTLKHSQEKAHVCNTCGKKFPFSGRLRKHMLTHTGDRPYHCETCGKQFRDSHSLRLHQKKHTGIGLHTCSICSKQFTNPFHLRRHERIHTGEKPYKCDLCGRTFARMDNLDAHKRTCSLKQNLPTTLISNSWSEANTNKVSANNTKDATQLQDGLSSLIDELLPMSLPSQVLPSTNFTSTSVNSSQLRSGNTAEVKSPENLLCTSSTSLVVPEVNKRKFFPSMLPQPLSSFPASTSATNLQMIPTSTPRFESSPSVDARQPQTASPQLLNFDASSTVGHFIGYGASMIQ